MTEDELHPSRLKLFRNALRFFTRAAKEAGESASDHPDNPLFACIHACMGLELIFKAILAQEHWTLIYDSPEAAVKATQKQGPQATIGCLAALERLQSVCGVHFKEKDLNAVRSINRIRNEAVHFDAKNEQDHSKALVAKALNIAYTLLDSELSIIESDFQDELKELRKTSSGFDDFLRERFNAVKSSLKGIPTCICHFCGNDSSIAGYGHLRCEVCHEVVEYDNLPSIYCEPCIECGTDSILAVSVVEHAFPDEDGGVTVAEVVCSECNQVSFYSQCPRCELFYDGDTFCSACTEHINAQ